MASMNPLPYRPNIGTGEFPRACRAGPDSSSGDEPDSRALPPLPALSADVAIRDWDDLFCAVKTRLETTVGEWFALPHPSRTDDATRRIQTGVLECVAALDQLHTTLLHELGRRQQLELELFDARTALAQTRADLVETRADEQQARHRALHDSLTALPNAGHFRGWLDQALAEAAPRRQVLAVLYLDLDNFKDINDAHGHDAGDELLRVIAARLSRAVRAQDMVSRLGGDEFACLIQAVPSREQLIRLVGKLFDAVSGPMKLGELTLSVRPSIGVAICPADGATTESLLRNADAAMYRAKRQQCGYAFFDEHVDVWAQETL